MTRKIPHPISREDFDKLVEQIKADLFKQWKPRKKEYTPTGLRIQQYLIALCLGFGAGMRISEIFGLEKKQRYRYTKKDGTKIDTIIESNIPALTPECIEENSIYLKVRKNKKSGRVPLPSKILRKAGLTRKMLMDNLPLKVSYRSMQLYITDLGNRVLKKHITFHQCRHGFITHALESGIKIHDVQRFAGHSRLDTTGRYLHSNPKKALDKYGEVF